MNILYRIYQLFFVLPIGLVITALSSIVVVAATSLGFGRWGATWPGRVWAWSIIRLLLLPVSVEGCENVKKGQSYIFMANHQGAFDIFLIYGFLHHEFKWMMKRSLFDIPFVGMACRRAGFIAVDNSSRHAIAQTMTEAHRTLQGGASLCVFPEGSRSYTGRMGKFRSGGFQLADSLQLPIVPMTIEGSFDVLSRQRGFNFVEWHPLRLVIHPVVYPDGQSSDDVHRLMKVTRSAIAEAMPEKYKDGDE